MIESSSPAATAQPLPPLRIGTRRSNMAVIQAEGIRDRLQKITPERSFEIEKLRTLGDKDQSTALYKFGEKGLWTAELEAKLTSGQLDVVVHCLKGKKERKEKNPTDWARYSYSSSLALFVSVSVSVWLGSTGSIIFSSITR